MKNMCTHALIPSFFFNANSTSEGNNVMQLFEFMKNHWFQILNDLKIEKSLGLWKKKNF
jgi:hypothetical protein